MNHNLKGSVFTESESESGTDKRGGAGPCHEWLPTTQPLIPQQDLMQFWLRQVVCYNMTSLMFHGAAASISAAECCKFSSSMQLQSCSAISGWQVEYSQFFLDIRHNDSLQQYLAYSHKITHLNTNGYSYFGLLTVCFAV